MPQLESLVNVVIAVQHCNAITVNSPLTLQGERSITALFVGFLFYLRTAGLLPVLLSKRRSLLFL